MKLKLALILALVLVLAMVIPAGAYYTTLNFTLVNSKTGSNWTHRVTAYAYDCASSPWGSPTSGTGLLSNTGVFSGVSLTSTALAPTSGLLCIYLDFDSTDTSGLQAVPADKWVTLTDGSSTADAPASSLIFYTDTGPTAVTLSKLDARPSFTFTLLPYLLAAAAVGLFTGGLFLVRKNR